MGDHSELEWVLETALDEASWRPLTQDEIAALRYAAGLPAPKAAKPRYIDLELTFDRI